MANKIGTRGKGRPKGAKNKTSATAKANIIAVFDKKGGLSAMVNWAKEHETEFYRLYAKLLPTEVEVTGEDGGPIAVAGTIKWGSVEIPL